MIINMKIEPNSKVDIKAGSHKGRTGIVTMVATINNKKRYYVERENKTIAWYNYHSIRLAK